MHPKRGPVPFEERMKSTKFLPLSRKQHRQGRSQTWSMNAEPVTTTASMLGGLQSPMIDLAATSGDCRVRPITVQGKLQVKSAHTSTAIITFCVCVWACEYTSMFMCYKVHVCVSVCVCAYAVNHDNSYSYVC